MARKSLAELSAAFKSKTSGEGNGSQNWKLYFNFWKAPVDSVSVVRFLPDLDEDNPLGFLVENLTHELVINGKREKVACLKMYGQDCPICALSADYYDEKSANHNEELGKKYYRKRSYLGQVIVLETPLEHDQNQLVKLIEFGPQVYKQIQAAFESGDMDEAPYELKGGYNFRFRKTVTGSGQNSYTTSNFAPKQSDVGDDVIETLLREDAPVGQKLFNLADYRTPAVTKEVIAAMLLADQTGSTFADDAEQKAAPAASVKSTPVETKTEDTSTVSAVKTEATEGGEKKLSVVEQLRARAAAAKAAQE